MIVDQSISKLFRQLYLSLIYLLFLFREQPTFARPPEYHEEYSPAHGNGFSFRDENAAQNLAYNGWNGQYRNTGKDIQAEPENAPKKSILPDS